MHSIALPGLWTLPPGTHAPQVRAAELLRRADVIIYDDLGAAAAVEQYAPSTAERVYVGKRGGRPSIRQPEIDALLVAAAAGGRTVVRLKGGCPSVFSRVGWAGILGWVIGSSKPGRLQWQARWKAVMPCYLRHFA